VAEAPRVIPTLITFSVTIFILGILALLGVQI
jgi:hypothetical protein